MRSEQLEGWKAEDKVDHAANDDVDRLEDFRRRIDEQPRRSPRAAGADAPPNHR